MKGWIEEWLEEAERRIDELEPPPQGPEDSDGIARYDV